MKNRFLSFFFALSVTACSVCGPEEGDVMSPSPDSKIIGCGELGCKDRLIVNVNEATAKALEEGDLSVFTSVEAELGELTVRRVFPVVPRTEKKAHRYGLHKWYVLGLPDGSDIEEAARLFAGLGHVNKVQFCTIMKKASDGISHPYTPSETKAGAPVNSLMNDPYGIDQWHYCNNGTVAPTAVAGADINLTDAWRICSGDPSVIVAVLDEGVQYDHPDLAENMWLNPNPGEDGYKDDNYGYNFAGNGGVITWNTKGSSGHGTHVAGTVAAVNNNGKGVCGVAGGNGFGNGVRIMSCQIFNGFSGGTPDVVAEAAKYAADHGASILQCSFGITAGVYRNDNQYSYYNGVEHDAFKYFMETSNCPAMDGGLIIFAAGNDTYPLAGYPGAYRDFICVTAFGADNLPTYYTNFGPGSNIAAPGGEYGTGFTTSLGTDPSRSEVLSTMPTRSFTIYVMDQSGNIYSAGQTAAAYGYMQGTSMACPHTSGVAALGLSYAYRLGRHFTHEEMVSMILTSTDEMDSMLSGTKQSQYFDKFSLDRYFGKMGTGKINSWKLLMQIEGTPYITTKVGETLSVNLEDYFGGSAKGLVFTDVSIPDADSGALGLEGTPVLLSGKLYLTPHRAGSAKLRITAIAGGNSLGGEDAIGGMEITKEISVIARNSTNDNGGWL